MFSNLEKEQYRRHFPLPGFGEAGQARLKTARVLLVGAGGLGCPAGLYLAGAGVGTLGIADSDKIERSNLHRQVAHGVDRIGQPKVESLIATLRGINPFVTYQAHPRLEESNVTTIIAGYDLVIDGSDNFATRFLLADACHLQRVPLLQGSVYGYEGQFSLFVRGEGACFRCLFEQPPSQDALAPCHEAGVLGVVPGTLGLLMATEAVKHLAGLETPAKGALLRYDALKQRLRILPLAKNRACPLCGEHPTIHAAKSVSLTCADFPDAWLVAPGEAGADALWLDVREPEEFAAGHMPGARHHPLSALRQAAPDLPPDADIVVYCQSGKRSRTAVRLLREFGFTRCRSLVGGFAALREQV